MKCKLLTLAALLLTLGSLFSQSGAGLATSSGARSARSVESKRPEASGDQESELVDIKANLVYPYKLDGDTSVLCLVGAFSAHHNGAIITADSAVRYGDDRLECFGNVLINKNTTYAYADRADYDGARNLAALYSLIVKVVDEDVTLYAHNFTFNTLDNVGYYWGGGVTIKEATEATEEKEASGRVEMESDKGYYISDYKQVVGVQNVELRGEGYEMKGDSVIYEMEIERAHFFERTNIWNEQGEYLYGDRGIYDKATNVFRVNKSAYLLTSEQEVWSDSMEYRREAQEAILWENIQMDDTTNKSVAFGDFGRYWGDVERILLTRNPSIINYDPKEVDSLFMRGDTIELLSYAVGTGPIVDSVEIKRVAELTERMAKATQSVVDAGVKVDDELEKLIEPQPQDPSTEGESVEIEAEDVEAEEAEETKAEAEEETEDSVEVQQPKKKLNLFARLFGGKDSLAKAERKAEYEAKAKAKAEVIETRRLADIDAYKAREYRKLADRSRKIAARINKRIEKGRDIYSDSMLLNRILEEMRAVYDTLPKQAVLDSISVIDSLRDVIAAMQSEPEVERDSLYRLMKAYRNVRSYRSDFQMVCDSLVGISYDSTMRLYINPVIWNQSNQITADEVDVYSANGEIDYADFVGNPIMSSEVISGDSTFYNQIKGKSMKVDFENSEVRRNDVDGNVQTIYYMEDDDTGIVSTIVNVESGTATFYIKEQTLDGITYRADPTYVIAPLDKMPSDVSHFLDGFVWNAEIRPTRNSVFDRTIRPSVREQRSALVHPTFPIMTLINEQREQYERRKVWRDRVEGVSAEATEWMQSLGYTPGQPRTESLF